MAVGCWDQFAKVLIFAWLVESNLPCADLRHLEAGVQSCQQIGEEMIHFGKTNSME